MKKIQCPKCASQDYTKKGWLKNEKNSKPIRRYLCKSCKTRFSVNSHKKTFLQNKPELNKKIMELYCEGNTLRGMSRLLGVHYMTVTKKFRFMANLARERHLKALDNKEIVTKYIQCDEMETFEKTRKQPLGIELSIRPKTGQILAAKVCRIPVKALTLSPEKKAEYKKTTNRKQGMIEILLETAKVLNEGYSVISLDGNPEIVHLSKIICNKSLVETHVNDHVGMWRLNHTCAKLRHHISRLKRKTWATTKDQKYLQMHLDLFIAYQNGYDLDAA